MINKQDKILIGDVIPSQTLKWIVIFTLFNVLTVMIITNTFPLLPEDPTAYPWIAETIPLKSFNTSSVTVPDVSMFDKGEPGLLCFYKNSDRSYEILQYNDSGLMSHYDHRVGLNQEISIGKYVGDLDHDGFVELIASREVGDKTELSFVNADKEIIPFDTLELVDLFEDKGYPVYPDCDGIYDTGHISEDIIYLYLAGMHGKYKNRWLAAYTRSDKPQRQFMHRLFFPFENIHTIAASQTTPGILTASSTYCNGVTGQVNQTLFPDHADDCEAYVIRWSAKGEVLWQRSLGRGGGKTFVTANEDCDTVFAIFNNYAFRNDRSKVFFYLLKGTTGEILSADSSYGRLGNPLTAQQNPVEMSSIVYLAKEGRERFVGLSSSGKKLIECPLPKRLSQASEITYLNLSASQSAIAFLTDGPSIALVDLASGRLLAKYPISNSSPLLQRSSLHSEIHESSDQVLLRTASNGEYLRFKKASFPGWIFARYRYQLLALVLPPAIVLAFVFTVRFYRVSLIFRKHERIYLHQLQALNAEMRSVQEEERKRISRDLHDQLGQSLSLLAWKASSIKGIEEELKEGLKTSINEAISQVRSISQALRPEQLDSFGLIGAIEWELKRFNEQSGIVCDFSPLIEKPEIQKECEIQIYRVLQEALSNILKHAQASKVTVNIAQVNGTLQILVIDDGIGVSSVKHNTYVSDQSQFRKKLGLLGMSERLRPYHGAVKISPFLPSGTVLKIGVPLNKTSEGNRQ